ncbi:hypothetical protein [Tsuneonella sp. SYSU-LHT278]|uniref:hypothetical protein n=1 Tax=Tsuneonella sediminis TaxID=3416089 RepID=UPI003F78F129
MRISNFAAFAVILSCSISAKDRQILWDKVEAGMSIAEVHAAYPQGGKIKWHGTKQTEIEDVVILEGCEAEVEIQHASGFVDVVKVKGKGSLGGRCADKVLTALSAKYGQPAVQRERGGSILARQGEVSVWSKDGVAMRFKQYTGNAFGGGGLGAASWELAYTASASEIAL